MAIKKRAVYYDNPKDIWRIKCDFAFPCATQNELDEEDAEALIKNGCELIAEGANLPCTGAAIEKFKKAELFLPRSKPQMPAVWRRAGLRLYRTPHTFILPKKSRIKCSKK